LLGHEQLHFYIAEIHRQIIVKSILNTKFSAENYELELRQLISKIWDEDYRKMQDQYDAETKYARLFRSQKEWIEIVATKLIELEKFNDTELTVTFQ
jgi:thiamine kinase-like enzyme|tara:strand:+ start:2908 stop:3198 length:291 start_codon:yes stop_codon:yes gene_type:complete